MRINASDSLIGPSTGHSFNDSSSMDPILFEKTARFVKDAIEYQSLGLFPSITDQEKLKLYALYKQATLGPCTGPRPSFFDLQGKYKYDAWKDLGDLSRTVAMHNYVEHVVEYAMSVQASLGDYGQRTMKGQRSGAQMAATRELHDRLEALKHDCATLWPQRYAHLRSPAAEEIADLDYEQEEVASFGQRDDTSFGTPLVLSDEIRIPFPSKISSLLGSGDGNGGGVVGGGVGVLGCGQRRSSARSSSDDNDESDEGVEGEDDPLHVKEPPIAEVSSESLNRGGLTISGELYEMVMSSFRRLDALEEATRKLQMRLDQVAEERRRTSSSLMRLIKVTVAVFGGAIVLSLLFKLFGLRYRLQKSLDQR